MTPRTASVGLERLAHYWKLQFDRLWAEGEQSGRVMCLPLHPFVSGRPEGIGHLRSVFEHIRPHDHVWHASGSEIADWYLEHCYDEQLAHAQTFAKGPSGRGAA